MPTIIIYICAAMLFVGAAPLPYYGYYTLLRLVACGVFAFAAFVSFDRKYKTLPWILGLLALLFNPIIQVHLPKEVWSFIDVGAAILLITSLKAVKTDF